MDTFDTSYGKITLYKNEQCIGHSFKNGNYWDEETLIKLKQYIDPNRNILEIGGHCGTSSIMYSSFLNDNNKVFVYEPQRNMYNLLVHNINQNNLQHKIIPHNMAVFCYEGIGQMHNVDLEGGGVVANRYTDESHLPCNFGGIGLGDQGESIQLTMVDSMDIEDIGLIHCDAQGAEHFIFTKAINTITKHRPVIYFEDNLTHCRYYYNTVLKSYPEYENEGLFDIKRYCMEALNYSKFIDCFNGGIDTLLIP